MKRTIKWRVAYHETCTKWTATKSTEITFTLSRPNMDRARVETNRNVRAMRCVWTSAEKYIEYHLVNKQQPAIHVSGTWSGVDDAVRHNRWNRTIIIICNTKWCVQRWVRVNIADTGHWHFIFMYFDHILHTTNEPLARFNIFAQHVLGQGKERNGKINMWRALAWVRKKAWETNERNNKQIDSSANRKKIRFAAAITIKQKLNFW